MKLRNSKVLRFFAAVAFVVLMAPSFVGTCNAMQIDSNNTCVDNSIPAIGKAVSITDDSNTAAATIPTPTAQSNTTAINVSPEMFTKSSHDEALTSTDVTNTNFTEGVNKENTENSEHTTLVNGRSDETALTKPEINQSASSTEDGSKEATSENTTLSKTVTTKSNFTESDTHVNETNTTETTVTDGEGSDDSNLENASIGDSTEILEERTDNVEINPLHFYNQLNDVEKLVYDGLRENNESLMDGKEVTFSINIKTSDITSDVLKKEIILAKRAYLADNPVEKIWMDNCKLTMFAKSGYWMMRIAPQGKFDTRGATETFNQVADEFVQTLSGTDSEKLQAIHNWLVRNVDYDLTNDNNGNVYGAIVEGRSVCSGFAYSFKYLADKAGLNVVYVQGYYYNPRTDSYAYHAWNMAEVDGEWLIIDVTFDNSLGNYTLHSWQDNTSHVHIPDADFTYPI